MKTTKLFFVAVCLLLLVFVGCRPTYFDVPWDESYYDSISNYWPITNGETLCYVSDNNDTIICEATIHKHIYHREVYQNEHPHDYFEGRNEYFYVINAVSDSMQNTLHRKIVIESTVGTRFASELENPGYYYPEYSFHVLDENINANKTLFYATSEFIEYGNKSSLTQFFTDSIALFRFDHQTQTYTTDTINLLIRNKGTVLWVDTDGHRWELVDLMNK